MEINKNQKESLFEALLSYSVKENVIKEIDEMPTEAQIKDKIHYSKTFEKKMALLIKKQKYKKFYKNLYIYTKKVAVFISIIFSIGFGTLMTVEAVQQAIVNTVVEWYEDHNRFIFKNTSNKSTQEILNESRIKLPTYIPEGFKLYESEEYDGYKLNVYKNEEKKNLIFNAIVITDKNETFMDNEHTEYEIIEINGSEVYLFLGKSKNNDYASAIWIEGNIKYEIDSWIGVIEVIRIIKNIK